MKVGYARVSTDDQKLDLQLTALKKAGCRRIFEDHGFSGKQMSRPGLDAMIESLQPGQTLIVWRLDRLGRSLVGLVQLIDELGKRGVDFHSLCEAVNTTSSGGRLVFHIMAALAEFERALISERTRAGMEIARTRGSRIGRPSRLSISEIICAKRELQTQTLKCIAEKNGVSSRTLQRHLKKLREAGQAPLPELGPDAYHLLAL